jgi:hypothetical protein
MIAKKSSKVTMRQLVALNLAINSNKSFDVLMLGSTILGKYSNDNSADILEYIGWYAWLEELPAPKSKIKKKLLFNRIINKKKKNDKPFSYSGLHKYLLPLPSYLEYDATLGTHTNNNDLKFVSNNSIIGTRVRNTWYYFNKHKQTLKFGSMPWHYTWNKQIPTLKLGTKYRFYFVSTS